MLQVSDEEGHPSKRQRPDSGCHQADEQRTEQRTSSPVTISAHTGGTTVAPQIVQSNIQGPVNVNIIKHCNSGRYDDSNPLCSDTSLDGRLLTKRGPPQNDGSILEDPVIILSDHKNMMKEKNEQIFEGIARQGKPALLSSVYTEIYIISDASQEVNNEHEVLQIEDASRTPVTPHISVSINDIFKSRDNKQMLKTVLTKGIAGIGKTVFVRKLILDWAEGRANQDIQVLFSFTFRELNTIRQRKFSAVTLIHHFFPSMKNVKYEKLRILFIFDGLDECLFPLNFKNECWCDETQELPLDVLLTNLINGNLFPRALLWITTRPAAAHQIPAQFVHKVTDIQGFKDPQKEEYFSRKFSDRNLANRIISHIKSSKSLHIMCHIPVFCWISAVVLEKMLARQDNNKVPKTLTGMYSQFLLIQTSLKNKKYYGTNEMDLSKLPEEDKAIIVKLGELAFQQLLKHNIMFCKEDLEACGIDVTDASVRSGVCTAVFKEEILFSQTTAYCFVHLTVQEFLAAFYVFHLFSTKKIDVLGNFFKVKSYALHDLHKAAVDKALESKNGHLDLFLRFLFGISLDSNKRILQGLLPSTGSSSDCIEKTIKYVKVLRREGLSPERCINLIHCLVELGDSSLVEQIENYIVLGGNKRLTLTECSALAYVLMMSEALDDFHMNKYKMSEEGLRRLVPVINFSRTFWIGHLSGTACKIVASALKLTNSHLTELHIGHSSLEHEKLESLCSGLKSPDCKLEILDLSFNKLTSSGMMPLCFVLIYPHCKLVVLDLSNTDLRDSGVKVLCKGLFSPDCKLQVLRLSGCQVTEIGCASLATALKSNPSHMRELDLSYNHPGNSGVKLLSAVLEDASYKLEKLDVDHGGGCRMKPGLLKYACHLTPDPNTANHFLSISNQEVKKERQEQKYPDHPERFLNCNQVLCVESLRDRKYWECELRECEAHVGVAYKAIGRKGPNKEVLLGHNDKSWSLLCLSNKVAAYHDKKIIELDAPPSISCRIGVYLDWAAGTLSFYRVSSDGPTHLYTFTSTFTEPLYAGFRVWTTNRSVLLCQLN